MRAASCIVAALLLFAPALAMAEEEPEYIFRWVDDEGTLQFTDRLGDVPQPYHDMYKELIKKEKQRRKEARAAGTEPVKLQPPPPRSSPPHYPKTVAAERARRDGWKNLVAHWRSVLGTATARLDDIDAELAQARLNPVLAQTPQVKKKIEGIQRRREAALAKVEAAQHQLLEELPARARKEHVPPKWLD